MTSLDPGQLPIWTLKDNNSMIEFILSITLKSLPKNLEIQNDFYIVFKCVLLLMGIILLSKLILSGRFWLVRIVKVQNNKKLICPNACEGLCLAACIFYIIDLFYRGFCLEWYWGSSNLSFQRGVAVLYSFRLFFLWLAGFIHVASTLLIWPLDPSKIKPFYWHLFLFGCPIGFLIAYLPFCIKAEFNAIKMNEFFVPLLKELKQDPQGQVTQQTIDIANQGFDHVIGLWTNSKHYASVALSFLFLILIGTIITGSHIILRAGRRYKQIKNANNEIQRIKNAGVDEEEATTIHSNQDSKYALGSPPLSPHLSPPNDERLQTASSTNSTSALTPSKITPITSSSNTTKRINGGTKHIDWRKFSHKRLLFYFFGFNPLPSATKQDIDLIKYGKPTQHSILTVLKDFYYFSIAQFTCLLIVELAMVACAFLVIINIIPDLRNQNQIPIYLTAFSRTAYIFFVLEIWVMVTIGSPLIVIMLWRQLYPIKVDFENDIYTRKEPVLLGLTSKWKSFKNQSKDIPSIESQKDQQNWHVSPSWSPSNRLNAMDQNSSNSINSPKLNSKDSSFKKTGANDIIIISGSPSFHDDSTTNADDEEEDEDFHSNSWTTTTKQDVCGLAGSDLGVRRIVLEALDSANKYPIRENPKRLTSSVWQRGAQEAEQNHQRQTSSSSPPPPPPPLPSTPKRNNSLRRHSHQTLTDSNIKRQSPQKIMLGRLGGSIRRGTIIGSTKEFDNSFSMRENPIIINHSSSPILDENAKFATPHGLVKGGKSYD